MFSMNRLIRGCQWLVFLSFLCSGTASCQTFAMVEQATGWDVESFSYAARIDDDGCLSRINGGSVENFLASDVGISRGSYFFADGPLKLNKPKEATENSLRSDSENASIVYEFGGNAMVWKLANKTDKGLIFFLVLADVVKAGRIGTGAFQRGAITDVGETSDWIAGNMMLSVTGSNRFWGPWEGNHQVVQVDLGANETRELTVTVQKIPVDLKAKTTELLRDPESQEIIIRSPREFQVFQRTSRTMGPFVVSGRVNVECDNLRMTVSGTPLEGTLPSSPQPVNFDPHTKSFSFSSSQFPTGGWFQLNLEALKGTTVVATQRVEHFGIGEVFVGAGQSNSTNSGQFRIEQNSGMVSSFSGTDWRIANDPQPGVHDNSQGGSYYPALGDLMYEKFKVPIGIAATGHGGTSVNQWQPGGELHGWMMTRIHQLGPQGFRAVLWHQGESDVGMQADEFYTKMKTIIDSSKQQAGWEFPWFVAQVSYHNPEKPSFESTRSVHAKLWASGVAMAGPDTDTLVGADRDFDGKGIHFSPQGLKSHGKLWFEKVSPWLDLILK